MRRKEDSGGFVEFERGLHERVMAFERELVADEMRAHRLASEGVPPVLRQAQLGGQRRERGELMVQTGQVGVLGGGGDAPLMPL